MHYVIRNLKKLRESKGYSQEYLADLVGIGQSAYNRMESGVNERVDLEFLELIAEKLGSSLEALIQKNPKTESSEVSEPGAIYRSIDKPTDAVIIDLKQQLEQKDMLITYLTADVKRLNNILALNGLNKSVEEAVLYKAK